ncbi:MAG: hypothetical protein GW858_07625 [Sphingomonadales bacterium]|nr:hypothetical protein [Sphingomonadales bacterium]NCQ19847.1 hypothetical protein [Sphingomonadales bacterium]NCT02987.1 hypothetical protein [Sphingomonadales bacterium]
MISTGETGAAPGWRGRRILGAAVFGVLVLAAALRWYGADFGLPALNDPDELMFELGAIRMLTSGSLNPGWFGHPATTTIYVLALTKISVLGFGLLTGEYGGPEDYMAAVYSNPALMILPGRLAMAAFGVLAIWQTWRLGRLLRSGREGWQIGIFAALLLAVSPVFVEYSQIIRSDVMGTAFMLLCLGAALRIAADGRRSDYGWAALWMALAVASKWPFAIVSLSVAGAWFAYLRTHSGSQWRKQLLNIVGFAAVAPLLLIIISPYLVIAFDTVLVNLSGEARPRHLGATGAGFFGNVAWYVSGPLHAGLGTGAFVLAAGGLVILARDKRACMVLLPFLAVHFLIICLHDLRWERWVVPILPIFALAFGIAAARILNAVGSQPLLARGFAWIVMIGIPLSLVPATIGGSAARMNDTRQQATRWLDRHAAPTATIMIESFAFDMVHRAPTVSFPLGEIGCVNAQAMIDGRIDYSLVEGARKGRSKFDYGTMEASARPTCVSDYYIVTEMARYADERTVFAKEYAAYAALLDEGEIIATFAPEPGVSVGPVVNIIARRQR